MISGERLFLVNVNNSEEKHAGVYWGLIDNDPVITRDDTKQMRLHRRVSGEVTPIDEPSKRYRLVPAVKRRGKWLLHIQHKPSFTPGRAA